MCRNDENVCKDTRRKVTLFTESKKTHTHISSVTAPI